MSGTTSDEFITGNIMNDEEMIKNILGNTYKSPYYSYRDIVISEFELTYVLNQNNLSPRTLWLKQFFPRSYTAEIPPHIMEMAINQIKANQLIRDVL